MANTGLWSITPQGPEKLKESQVGLDRQLEDWIEKDPALLQGGLTIIGRQIRVESGPLDRAACLRSGEQGGGRF